MATTTSIGLSSLDGSNGFRLTARASYYGSYLDGVTVSNVGDMNGDGFDDVGIGFVFDKYYRGSFVVFGKASGFSATMSLFQLEDKDGFGINGVSPQSFVDSAGDINGDGFDDVAIVTGFEGYESYYSNAYVIFGKSGVFSSGPNLNDLDGSNGFRLDGVENYDFSGRSFSNAGDVNGDGFDDVIIGAQSDDQNGYNSGSSYLVFGKSSGFDATINLSNLDGSNGFRLNGAEAYDRSGRSVANAGDFNGDGFDDVIIGSSVTSYVVFGKASGFDAVMNPSDLDGTNGFRLDGEEGRLLSSAGDFNGDGFDDVIISSSVTSYVVFGKASRFDTVMNLSDLDGSNGFRLDGVGVGSFWRKEINSAGDVNGDGFDDLIIGTSEALYGSPSGSSYVVFGKASGFDATMNLSDFANSNSVRFDGVGTDGESGESVSGAGDVNGDGFDDLIIGALDKDSNVIFTYVVFGRSQFTGIVTYVGTPENDVFTGTSAAEVFNTGDGNDRIIGRGGADTYSAGAGNDYIRISDANFQLIDGGTGIDILGLAGSGFNLNLSSVQGKVHGIEIISLYGVGDNALTLTAQDVLGLSDNTDILKIKGNAGDSVIGLSSGWADGGVHGNFHTYTQGEAVILVGVNVTTDFA